MRRLAAVFSKRDKSDSSQPSSSRSHPSSTQSLKKHLKLPLTIGFTSSPPVHTPSSVTSTPQLSSASEHGQSSGSSSGSASLSLPTPDEDPKGTSLARSGTRRSWKDWFGGKRSEPTKLPVVPKPTEWDRPMPVWNERPPTLQGPRASDPVAREADDTDEASSSEFDDEASVSLSDHSRPPATLTTSPARARQNFELLIKNSLLPLLPSSPFAHHSATHLFPRSCNRPQGMPATLDLRRTMFNRQLLQRLEALSGDDERMILALGSMSAPVSITTPVLSDHNAVRPPSTTRIFSASPGLRRWISRSCFEDRFIIVLPSNDGIHQGPVVGTLAVAALEYSEFLDVMVDPDFDPSSPPLDMPDGVPWTPTSDHPSLNSPPLPIVSVDPQSHPASTTLRHSYISSPSPLRNQHSLETPPPQPMSPSALPLPASPTLPSPVSPPPPQSDVSSPPSPTPPQPNPVPPMPQLPKSAPVKRVVRFVEDDSEDAVPLHLLRQKKMREEKAKFLRTEQRKRMMEQEQERRRLEAEAIEKERRRLAVERERKEMDQRLYAGEVAAARARRESQRAGVIPGLKNDTNGLLVPSPSSTSLRETERNGPRASRRHSLMPHHTGSSSSLPRREASDSALQTPSHCSHETSSYRASSTGHSPAGSNSGHGHSSRPGSMYSTSSEDGRPSSKRYSAVASISSNTTRPSAERPPIKSGSNQSLSYNQYIPPVPPLPEFMNDFVLLPPSAPFMMHRHPRQSRHSSPGPSNSSRSLRGNSTNSSSERVNVQRQSSPRPMETYSAPPSPGTSSSRADFRPTHSRHGSGDSRRSSMPVPARSQPSSLSRGRSQMPHSQTTLDMQYLQPPNPWTALPTQHGALPTAMPVSAYSHSTGPNTLGKSSSSGGSSRGKGGAKR